ncbi:MAG: hypothetical protein IGS48_00595 [Oscillatoriales cyanobacterium C42_A2020_001]|nr:hypothetical protein [Leptolyngbyaceae cyanobacterium C42_A2020_001]
MRYVYIGTSHDTSEFAYEAVRQRWNRQGSHQYQTAGSILLLGDAGVIFESVEMIKDGMAQAKT